ncbi:MAG: selB [Marmoricola sp.]|nr:selB [Marmoricola sp.]
MHVVATAGHVDHGKSALVKVLTGTDPDRLEEEHRRGLSIQLGYAWTSLPGIGDLAFVDVPGHERFISTMLAGVGPVPAVLFVVAADDPWMPQAAEHLAALDALGVQHGIVAITRSDLADPAPAAARTAAEVRATSLRGSPVVTVSSRTGAGLDDLRTRLVELVLGLPEPDPDADVRLWVDRRFTISGAGTVVTGTLPAGTIKRGDTLSTGTGTVRVRGVQSLEQSVTSVSAVARVALNLTGAVEDLDRSSVLTTPEAHHWTEILDIRVSGDVARLPTLPMLHVGAQSLTSRCRPLAGDLVRLTLPRPLPLRVGDRALLRDPGSREVWGVHVLDPLPPQLRRRGAAQDRARALRALTGRPDLASEVERRGVVNVETLRRIGVPDASSPTVIRAGTWRMSADRAEHARSKMLQAVTEHARTRPLDPGLPLSVLAEQLDLPSPELVAAVVQEPLSLRGGRVLASGGDALPAEVEEALVALAEKLAGSPFSAPTADGLRDLGLDATRVAAAAKAGRLLRLAPGIVLMPDAGERAVEVLGDLPQPFTTSEARSRLGTSRRVVLPLLEHLDRARLTRRLPDDRRVVVKGSGP